MKQRMAWYVLFVIVLSVFGGLTWAGIEGSKHDFTTKAWSGGDLCAACHTPHREAPPTAAPLWDPEADLSRRFGNAIGGTRAPGSGTLSCARCHDGTIARDTISGVRQERLVNRQNPDVFGTGHGSTDHPVGVEYPRVDKGYRSAVSVTAVGAISLPEGKVECVSCHDPHNTAGAAPMLVMSNARSALCLACHKK